MMKRILCTILLGMLLTGCSGKALLLQNEAKVAETPKELLAVFNKANESELNIAQSRVVYTTIAEEAINMGEVVVDDVKTTLSGSKLALLTQKDKFEIVEEYLELLSDLYDADVSDDLKAQVFKKGEEFLEDMAEMLKF